MIPLLYQSIFKYPLLMGRPPHEILISSHHLLDPELLGLPGLRLFLQGSHLHLAMGGDLLKRRLKKDVKKNRGIFNDLIISYNLLVSLIMSHPILSYLIISYHILSYLVISYHVLSTKKTMGIRARKMRLQPAKCSRCSPDMMVDRRFSPTLLKQGHAVGIAGNKQYNRSQINFERCLHKCHSIKRINDLFYLF